MFVGGYNQKIYFNVGSGVNLPEFELNIFVNSRFGSYIKFY